MVFECKAAGQCTVIDHLNYARWVTFSIYYVFFSFQIWLILHLQIMVVSFRFFYLFISIECLFHVFSILVFKVSPKNLQLMYTKYSHTKNFDFFLYMYIAMMTGYKTEKAYWNIFYEPFFLLVHLQYKQCSSLSKYILHSNSMIMCSLIFMK